MRHNFTKDDVHRHWHGEKRPPLRSAKEMAKEFGLDVSQLAAHFRHDPNAPKPVLKKREGRKESWYDPLEVRLWWMRRNAA